MLRKSSDDTLRNKPGKGKNEKCPNQWNNFCGILKWHPQGVWVRLWRGWHYDWQIPRSHSHAPPFLYSSFSKQRLGLYRPVQARIPPAPCRGLEEPPIYIVIYMYGYWVKTPRWEISMISILPLELNLDSFLKCPPKIKWEKPDQHWPLILAGFKPLLTSANISLVTFKKLDSEGTQTTN